MRPVISVTLLAGAAIGASSAPALADDPAPAASNDEIRAIVAEMLSDAETRSSLLQAGGGAGHDGKFFLASPDGNFRLNIGGQVQFRYNLVFRDDDTADTIDDFEPGFQTRRTKLSFDGHVYDPNLFYKVQGAFNRNGGNFNLDDAYVGYRFDNGITAQWGQFKLPFLREELVSSKRQLAADRSFTNEVFNQDRSQAIQISYATDNWRAFGAFSDGINSDDTDLGGDPADWALTGRFEFLFAGSWAQFRDFTSPRGSEDGLMLGVAGHVERGIDAPGGGDNETRFSWTVDGSWESDGWGLYAAFIGNHDSDGSAAGRSADEYGWLVQGSYYLTDDIEAFARYDMIIPDSDPEEDNAFNTLTVGANYYIHGHAAKFTTDVQLFFDDVAGSDTVGGNNTGIGFLDNGAEGGEYTVRFQFQLLF